MHFQLEFTAAGAVTVACARGWEGAAAAERGDSGRSLRLSHASLASRHSPSGQFVEHFANNFEARYNRRVIRSIWKKFGYFQNIL